MGRESRRRGPPNGTARWKGEGMSGLAQPKSRPGMIAWPVLPVDSAPMTLWTAETVARPPGATPSAETRLAGVATDSREVEEGGLFVALKGEAMDGHGFVPGAFQHGAALALVS